MSQPEETWETLAVGARTHLGRPTSTIKPRDRSLGTTGHHALDAFVVQNLGGEGAARIEMGRVLGEGGMGIVHLATQTTMHREVAVKALRPQLRQPGPTLKLLQEAWTTGRLEHPNIVPIYDITAAEDGSPLILLKRIEGESWAEILADPEAARDRYEVSDLLEWHLRVLISVCNAIHFAHDRGIAHLDLKPENVMIGSHGEVYVVDWGIAMALVDDGCDRLSLAADCDEVVGTPSYMAPEMLRAEAGSLSAWTDIYLLGAILYEVLSGHAPHRGETIMEVLHAVAMERPESPHTAPTELVEICERAMATEPEDRFSSADELRRALLGFLRHRESEVLGSRASERVVELEKLIPRAPGVDEDLEDPGANALFTEACFGFEQALASWPDNHSARAGLSRVVRLMVEHELNQGDPQAAATHARRGEDLPEALRQRLEEALRRRRAGLDELVQLRRDRDFSIGQRTRVFVVGLLGLLWTVAPFVEWLAIRHTTGSRFWVYLAVPVVSLVMFGGLAYWARESLTKTRVNRQIMATVLLALVAQISLMLGAALLGVSADLTISLLPLVWAVILGMAAISFELWAGIASLTYLLGFFVGAMWPQWRFLVIAVCNFGFMVSVLVAWWPERVRGELTQPDHRA